MRDYSNSGEIGVNGVAIWMLLKWLEFGEVQNSVGGRDSVSAMATRRVSWFRARVVNQEVTSSVHYEDKENVNPMPGDELEIAVQERHILLRCQSRRHPRIPLRDITHLFPGNAASLDDKSDASPPIHQSLGNGPVRRPQDSRKRRQAEPASEMPTVRRVLRKFR